MGFTLFAFYNIDDTARALIGQKPMFCQSIQHKKTHFIVFRHITYIS